jgi:peptidoglycan/xylan/chitin deacetylase (PgdA/CDA1 family)
MRGLTRLKRYSRRFIDYFDPKAVILMYHRIIDLPGYTYPICVTPENFRSHMAYLKQAYRPMRLEDLASAVKHRSIPRGAVAITFDDGYADNYLNALQVIDELQVPATIFISTGSIDGNREFWWDDLDRVFIAAEAIPIQLDLSISGEKYSWSLDTLMQRMSTRKEIHRLLKPLLPHERGAVIDEIVQWAGLNVDGRNANRAMTCHELKMISASPNIDLGGHTVNHPQLSAIPPEVQRQEILKGRRDLENMTGKPVRTFSYPFGGQQDFSPETVEIVRDAGFDAACTTEHTRVRRNHDVLLLPRYWVGDWDLLKFKDELNGFFQN